jgi:transcriptional regulator with XRE-family HTH domain
LSAETTLRIDRLRAIRVQRGLSQRELARLCKIGESLINKYESGSSAPNIDSLKLIAETLQISSDFLLGITDDPRGHLGDGKLDNDELDMLATYRREGWTGVIRLGAEKLAK